MAMKWPLAVVVMVLILVAGCVTVLVIVSDDQDELREQTSELFEQLGGQIEAIAMGGTYQQVIDACAIGDLERAAELETASRPACSEGGTASFEMLSSTVSQDGLTGTLVVERVRADNGDTQVRTLTFKKNVEGIWLLESIK